MAKKALIIVPSQGKHVSMFQRVAKAVAKKVYGGSATVAETVVLSLGIPGGVPTLVVLFRKLDGKQFSWDETHDLSTVVTISHGSNLDGPNMAYGAGGYQPWGREDDESDGGQKLTANAAAFWGQIGGELKQSGKIVLVGCSMGDDGYASDVAREAGRTVFAAKDSFAAADRETTIRHLKAIEDDSPISPMKRFAP